jgi:hypothetical protein
MMGLPPRHILRSKSPSYPGVDLCAARLRGEGADGTTWPRRYLHGRLSLMKWSNPAIEKNPQNLCVHQSSLQQSSDDLQQGLHLVEVSLSHIVLLDGMGDGMVTHKRMDRRISVVTRKEPCSLPLDRRVRHQNGNVGINLRPRADQDVDIA